MRVHWPRQLKPQCLSALRAYQRLPQRAQRDAKACLSVYSGPRREPASAPSCRRRRRRRHWLVVNDACC